MGDQDGRFLILGDGRQLIRLDRMLLPARRRANHTRRKRGECAKAGAGPLASRVGRQAPLMRNVDN